MSNEQMRAEFEAWALPKGFSLNLLAVNLQVGRIGHYEFTETREAWAAWQACATQHQQRIDMLRAALAELADSHTAEYPAASVGDMAQRAWVYRKCAAIDRARAALAATTEQPKTEQPQGSMLADAATKGEA